MRFSFLILIFLGSVFSIYAQDFEFLNYNEYKVERDSTPIIQDQRITELMEKHKTYNVQKKGILGYRIQIYSGVGGDTRKKASAVRTKFLILHPDVPVEILYNEPYFKVRVGLFRNKAEGFKLFKEIQKDFPGSYFIIENEMEFPPL